MFYKNTKKLKKDKGENLVFSIFDQDINTQKDGSVKKPNECEEFYNLTYQDGALKTGLGFQDLQVPTSEADLTNLSTYDFSQSLTKIENIWLQRWFNTTYEKYVYQLLLMDDEYKIFGALLIDEYGGLIPQTSSLLQSAPTLQCGYRLNDSDASIFFSKEGLLALGEGFNQTFSNVPAMISCATHYGFFFGILATSRSTLVYKKDLDLTNWTNDNNSTVEFMDERGAFTKLVGFNDYVYLFREHGITKISIYTSKNDFSFSHLYTSTSKIFENTICVCGNKILFATRDGLYAFNGNSVDKICENYDGYFKNCDHSKASCACLNGKYYLATNCNFLEGEIGCEANTVFENNLLLEIDLDSFKLNLLRGVDIKKILAIDTPYFSKLIAIFNDKVQKVGELCFNGKDFLDDTSKLWKSAKTDLGYPSKRKKIKEILIDTKYDCKLEIVSNLESKTFDFEGKDELQKYKISIFGDNFQFFFKIEGQNCQICKPTIIFEVVE